MPMDLRDWFQIAVIVRGGFMDSRVEMSLLIKFQHRGAVLLTRAFKPLSPSLEWSAS